MSTLEELCREVRNWFVVDRGMIFGRFTITDGVITPSINLQFGQYYRIIGSVFNDGLHRFDEQDTLVDEEFNGAIWLLAIPPAVQQLATEIEDYKQTYEKETPYASESFGGYSYQKATGKDGEPIGWRSVFSDRLKAWRKI